MKCLIKRANVFDGYSSALRRGVNIVIEDDLVREMTSSEVCEKAFDTVIEAEKFTTIPGLIDCHVHISISDICLLYTSRCV